MVVLCLMYCKHFLYLLEFNHAENHDLISQYQSVYFFDIEAAYDMMWREGLLIKLDELGATEGMFKWVQYFSCEETDSKRA
jgi:hypothetical protein